VRILAVDLGASSGRTIVGEVESGAIRLEETYRFENSMTETGGTKRWDVSRLLEEIKTGIAAAGDLDSIGIDTWGVDYGLIDAGGDLLEEPFAYRDGRHETAIPRVYEIVPKQRLYRITGMQELPFNTIFQLVAEKTHRPDLHERADRLLMMPELLTYLLTGRAQSEYSISSTTGLLNAGQRDWDRDLIRTLGLPERLFGPIAMPGARAGEYRGTPVVCPAMHDTGSAVAAVPAVEAGEWAYLSSGTWSLIGAELDEPILTDEAADADFTNEGGVDGRIRGLWLIQECRRIWAERGHEMTFAEIAAAAEDSDYRGAIDPNDLRYLAPENMVEEILSDLKARGEPAPATYRGRPGPMLLPEPCQGLPPGTGPAPGGDRQTVRPAAHRRRGMQGRPAEPPRGRGRRHPGARGAGRGHRHRQHLRPGEGVRPVLRPGGGPPGRRRRLPGPGVRAGRRVTRAVSLRRHRLTSNRWHPGAPCHLFVIHPSLARGGFLVDRFPRQP